MKKLASNWAKIVLGVCVVAGLTVGVISVNKVFNAKENKVTNNAKARVIRDDIVVYTGKIKSLQHEKDQVKEVKKGMDCGITLDGNQDYKENDIIEVYELVEIKR